VTSPNAFTVTVPARGKTTVRFGIRRTDMEPAPTRRGLSEPDHIQDTAGPGVLPVARAGRAAQLLGLGLPIHNPFEGLWGGRGADQLE
jgi:hypothetical protein